MNILPKKRWHVRTKENIARVRRDEAKAKEEEQEKKRRIELAEKEARLEALRQASRSNYDGSQPESSREKAEHVNFFRELEEGKSSVKRSNKEYESEKKDEQEKYEKQIGYLTYLGQDTVESTGKVSWFNKLPERYAPTDEEVETDRKRRHDPLEKINGLLKHVKEEPALKKHKKKKSRKDDRPTIEELRAKRLRREAEEKARRELVLAKLTGKPLPQPANPPAARKQKYYSQFNPELARQNKIDGHL
ncbi:leukocyte receptor cluster member 1 homolog [Cimex lectularius]|uniref:CBF1-interacting co-repressor CIR N-terminal domain-containing protein n=1 Tax=Cimex lectularius TaxID=79782 RepID=A0A8I6RUQ1_CIMLE|nr:leukocyte receptor cluster member 1 homolog [Cimex lectularius]